MLSRYLQLSGCQTHHTPEDVDLLIVSLANTKNTALVGEDTYMIILLCFYANLEAHDLSMYSQTESTTKQNRVWNMKTMKRQLGADVCENILFIHAALGCDTTSRLHSLGKGASKIFTTSTLFQAQSPQFLAEDESPDVVETAGEKALMSLYKGKPDESLDSLMYKVFCVKRSLSIVQRFGHKPYRPHLLRRGITAEGCTFRYNNGEVTTAYKQWIGDGE